MRPKKPRPPVWQQGASRSYIENPDAEPDSFRFSPRARVIARIIQVLLVAAAMATLVRSETRQGTITSSVFLWLWPSILLDVAVLRRPGSADPKPRRRPRDMWPAVAAYSVVALWLAWVILLDRRVLPFGGLAAWLPTGIVGFGLAVVGFTLAERLGNRTPAASSTPVDTPPGGRPD